jgi:7-cyano-7-deazaguanine synthase
MSNQGKPAVALLSGGMDSATVLAIAKSQGYAVHALSFDYGQRNRLELECARKTAMALGAASHVTMRVDLGAFGGSALTADIPVPTGKQTQSGGVPATYVPARNTVFLSLALAFAETKGASDIFIGVNALDYSGYPDCRPEYIRAFETMANLATKLAVEAKARVAIHAPLIEMTKGQIVSAGLKLGVDYSITLSCYAPAPTGEHCGQCAACQLRKKGFDEAGAKDPAQRH